MTPDSTLSFNPAQRGLYALEQLDQAVLALGWTVRWADGTIVPYADDVESLREQMCDKLERLKESSNG